MARPFQFFDREAVESALLKTLEVTCCASRKGRLVFGDHEGVIRVLDASLAVEVTFRAYDSAVTHLKPVSRNVLVSIGNDARHEATIKFWDLAKRDRAGRPTALKTLETTLRGDRGVPYGVPLRLNLNPGLPIVFRGNADDESYGTGRVEVDGASLLSPVIAFDVSEALDLCVLGLSNGDICVYRGDLLYTRYPRPQFLVREPASANPVTFVGLKPGNAPGCCVLFAVYEDSIGLWRVTPKGIGPYEPLAEFGAPPECACLCEEPVAGDLAVARPDGVIFFAEDIAGQGACWAFEGVKRKVSCFRHNLLVVTDEAEPTSVGLRRVLSEPKAEACKAFTVTIYDVRNKFKVFSGGPRHAQATFPNVGWVLADGASILIITNEGGDKVSQQIWKLKEKDTQTKLDMFFKKQMYKEAINLAKSQQFDAASIAEITKKYADRLYSDGKFDEAVEQYIQTIPEAEPSYVIWKLLDAQRIYNLRRYLEALHTKKAANADHTTLLLQCYTKLGDSVSLDRFLAQPGVAFDVQTAIRVCRQAGFYANALQLATAHGDHDACLKIRIEDLQQYREALEALRRLPLRDAEAHLQRHGRTLLRHLPEETTQTITDICTAWPSGPPASPISPNTPASPVPPPPPRPRATPDKFQQCFVDAPSHLLSFLEFVIGPDGPPDDGAFLANPSIWNTLLELHLRPPVSSEPPVRNRRDPMRILRDPRPKYDPAHALMLCQSAQYQEGTAYLYAHKLTEVYGGDEAGGRSQLQDTLLNHYILAKDSAAILQLCAASGPTNPTLWLQALQYFVQTADGASDKEIRDVLTAISSGRLLHPLAVVTILARTPKTTLGAVREYLCRGLEADVETLRADERLAGEYAADTAEKRATTAALSGAATVVQTTKCAHCHSALVIPATHFLCKHSFHDRCLGESEDCLLCQPELRKIGDMTVSLSENRDNHNAFFAHLRDSTDRFSTIADYFGRDLFGGSPAPPPLEEDSDTDTD